VDNLLNFVYPNGVTSAYSYDALNRLTQMGASKNSSSISNYAYLLFAWFCMAMGKTK
jgi:YD repeat-containing protein